MEKEVLLKNETELTDENFKEMMLYKKFRIKLLKTIIKLSICAFIIYATIKSDFHIIDKMFCIFMSILGIIDTLKIKEKRLEGKVIFKYDFYANYFYADNGIVQHKIRYDEINYIVERKEYYYFILEKEVPIMISKKGFTLGTYEEMIKIIELRKKVHRIIEEQERNHDEWVKEFETVKKIDLEKYFNKEDFDILKRLKIVVPIGKLLTQAEFRDIEIAVMEYTFLDKNDELIIKENMLKQVKVSLEEFDRINDILFRIYKDCTK